MTAKRIISLLLAIAMLVCVLSLTVSCGGDDTPSREQQGGENNNNQSNNNNNNSDNKGIDYTVTLVDVKGNPIAGIQLKFTYDGKETEVLTSGADGKATKKIDTYEDVIVEFVELGNYGNLALNQRNLNGETEKTLTLPTKVTINVVDEAGNPIAGVKLQVCHNVCISPMDTNAEGKLVVGISSDSQIKVSVVSVPEGYAVPETIGEYQGVPIHAYFEDGAFEVTITIPNA